MVEVIVREQDEIDFVELRIFCGSNDAISVAVVEAGPACIDQKGLSGRGNEERGLAALDINKVDLKSLSRLGTADAEQRNIESQSSDNCSSRTGTPESILKGRCKAPTLIVQEPGYPLIEIPPMNG